MMRDGIYIVLYLVTEFLNYMLGYTVLFGIELTKTKRNWVMAVVIILLIHGFVYYFFGLENSCGISFFSMILLPVSLLRPVDRKNFLLYPFVVIGISIVGVCVSFIVANIVGLPEYKIINSYLWTIGCQSVSVLGMLVIKIFRKIKHIENIQINLNWKQYLIMYAVVISLILLLAPIQALTRIYGNHEDINNIGLAASVACIVLVIVTIWQAIISTKEKQMEERNFLNETYMQLQKEYYEQLMSQDETIRRFRHDMNAHIQVMQTMCEEDENQELKKYLQSIIKESAVNEVRIYTGNNAVDAIIRKTLEDAGQNHIKVEIKGMLPQRLKIQEIDLCTIVSNLLKNAVEACEKIEDNEKRCICLEVGIYGSQIYICVKNTISDKVVIKNHQLYTTKKDRKNHGIGTKNIQRAVKKYGGIVEFRCENDWFMAEIQI